MAKKNVKKQAMSLLSLLATIVVVAGGYLLSDKTRAVTLLIIPIMSISLRQVKAHLVRNWLVRY